MMPGLAARAAVQLGAAAARRIAARAMTRRGVATLAGLGAVSAGGNALASSRKRKATRQIPRRKKYARRTPGGNEGGYRQWTVLPSVNTKLGTLTRNKITKLSVNPLVFRWQNIGPTSTPGGAIYMFNSQVGTGNWSVPLHLYDISACVNYFSGATQTPNIGAYLQVTNTGDVNFATLTGVDNTGAGNPALQLETSANGATNLSVPYAKSIFEWAQIKLNLHGATNRASRYYIQVVQIDPRVIPTTYFGQVAGNDATCKTFWSSLFRNLVRDPLEVGVTPSVKQFMKVLRSYTVHIDPTATYETDTDPHMKTLKIFMKMNRMCRWDWSQNALTVDTPAELLTQQWELNMGENQNMLHPKARIFLMIRATNYVKDTTGTPPITTTPTYDICLRMKHLINV